MRKIVLTLAALAAFGIALPVVSSTPSDARDVVVIKKKHRDHGWRHHHRDRVVIKEGRRHHRGGKVVIRGN